MPRVAFRVSTTNCRLSNDSRIVVIRVIGHYQHAVILPQIFRGAHFICRSYLRPLPQSAAHLTC